MKEYGLALLSVSAVIAFVEFLIPEENRSTARYVRFLTSLCLICVLIQPVAVFLNTLTDISLSDWMPSTFEEETDNEYKRLWEQTLEAAGLNETREQLAARVCEKFGLAAENCRVTIRGEEPDKTVVLILSGRAIWQDPEPMIEYVERLTGYECLVAVE